MSQELLYTSAPQGLKPGSRGFCTVLSTQGMSAPLATALEGLSGYRPVYAPSDERSDLNPVVWSHLKLPVAGKNWHVLSRIADYGLDYSQRTNKLAHHVVMDPKELGESGPARLLTEPSFMRTEWNDEPRVVAAKPARKLPTIPPRVCQAWKDLTGDAGWAGVLAESFLKDPDRPIFLMFEPGYDLLPLIAESISVLPPERRWEVTFSTYFTGLPQGATCTWRGLLKDSPEAHQSLRFVKALRIDLTDTALGKASGGDLVQAAREARIPHERSSLRAEYGEHDDSSAESELDELRSDDAESDEIDVKSEVFEPTPSVPTKFKTVFISNGSQSRQERKRRTLADVESDFSAKRYRRGLIIGGVVCAVLFLMLGIFGVWLVRGRIVGWLKPEDSQKTQADGKAVASDERRAAEAEADEPKSSKSSLRVSTNPGSGSKSLVDAAESKGVVIVTVTGGPSVPVATNLPPTIASKGVEAPPSSNLTSEGKSVASAAPAAPKVVDVTKEVVNEVQNVFTEVAENPLPNQTTHLTKMESGDLSQLVVTLWSPIESAIEGKQTKSKYSIKEMNNNSASLAEVGLKQTILSNDFELKALSSKEKLSRLSWCKLDFKSNKPDQKRREVWFHQFPIDSPQFQWKLLAKSEMEAAYEVTWILPIKSTPSHVPELYLDDVKIQIGSEEFEFSEDCTDDKASHPIRVRRISGSKFADQIKDLWTSLGDKEVGHMPPRIEMQTSMLEDGSYANVSVILRLVIGSQLRKEFSAKYSSLTSRIRDLVNDFRNIDESLEVPLRTPFKNNDPISKKLEADLALLKSLSEALTKRRQADPKSAEINKKVEKANSELQSLSSAFLKFERLHEDLKQCEIKSTRVFFRLFSQAVPKSSVEVDLIRYPSRGQTK